MRTAYVRRITKELIEKYNYQPPIPVEDLIAKLGLTIREVSTELDIDAKLDANKMRITVNRFQTNPFRRRFSLAHELGHFVLNHHIKPWEFEDPETGKSFVEPEADEFAGSLLLPQQLLTEHIKKGVPLNDIQTKFQVSNQALWVRLEIYRLTKFLRV
ncbi:ImmA/IrrE family metallo-endopeptidase [Aquibacillus salsiterrae]|uniref:ImmA/IrrE family metallo-endopeptidase n=1 Tax=Aquibacillus salsiterrae TaxID=2950439 RepID=A0A9X3WFV1_9BACI|nr:ImmA/IrrE family metallo-endopeptidase [Aquibacillus salsiterrae]MDC3416674.1 ImmA/IrrE family metallo-endopeptidase [Aquibacillus salsiterrae]